MRNSAMSLLGALDPVTISHEGYLEILITALGVMAAVVALAAALLGFVGYQSVKQEAITSAKRVATEQATETAKQQVAQLVDEKLRILAENAIRHALEERNRRDQGAQLGQSEAEDVPIKTHGTHSVLIRPVKRVVTDSEIGDLSDDS